MGSLKPLILASVLFVALLAVGYAAITSSSYMDVSQLADKTRPIRATVKGSPAYLGINQYTLVIGDSMYRLDTYGSYGVAELVQGSGYGPDSSYAVFILEGDNGFKVVALYSAKEFRRLYGGRPVVSERVVVEGVYKPDILATIITPFGEKQQYPVFMVEKILEGCHSSYTEPVGRISG